MLSKSEMIDEIKNEMIYYLKNGYINSKEVINIDGYLRGLDTLIDIHFILSKEVVSFIELIHRNTRFVNSTKKKIITTDKEIRGPIEWDETFKSRFKFGNDKNIFTIGTQNLSKETKENIVLKKALLLIESIYSNSVNFRDYRSREWYSNSLFIENVLPEIMRNKYISNIDCKSKISKKDINNVLRSKHEVYRLSANVLKKYRGLMNFDNDYINDLFKETYIDIADEDVVFEMYSIIKYLKIKYPTSNFNYSILDGNEDCMCMINDSYDSKIFVYHNKVPAKYINFKVLDIDLSNQCKYSSKILRVNDKINYIRKMENMMESNIIWNGRPDLVEVKTKGNKVISITIGEVKFTKDHNYMMQGMYELLEYLELMNSNLDYEVKTQGLLFVPRSNFINSNYGDIEIISSFEI